jgi:hypothetical protein
VVAEDKSFKRLPAQGIWRQRDKTFFPTVHGKEIEPGSENAAFKCQPFEGVGRITDRITKTGRLVGYKITVMNPDTVATLSHIGLQLDQAQNPVTIYLYHSSSNLPVQTFTLNHTKSIQFQWHQITSEILSFMSDTVNAGGSYSLVYYEDELTGSAIKKDVSFSGKNTCGSCSEAVVNSSLYNKWSKFISIQPFSVSASDLPRDGSNNIVHQMWDEEREIYQDDVTWA